MATGYVTGFRLPSQPYPGLRPFLDYEAALLFGRQRQVREVIERLAQSQFVVVLGGSGSGKSSLIHAGVVPELRSHGLAGAGDLWLPMSCTPGTNVNAKRRGRHSPVTRLVRRFAGLLNSRGSEQADLARQDEMAQVFRQEAGFARLLEVYGKELALAPGLEADEARLLFVLDQFEEIFHPTNKVDADARLLVERVLDHFFHPHPRCHVVLTMRSEHLNDCAAFLELPDAINKSSYLIRRLDADELREAIVGPAQRYLRLLQRQDSADQALPDEVVFEPAVLQRVLADVQAIVHDPDHLPLLQHLLARIWEQARLRHGPQTLIPAVLTEQDLLRAVHANDVGTGQPTVPAVPWPAGLNTLRASLNNWPEWLYAQRSPAERVQLSAMLRELAFKDPSTGLYSQQRVEVDEVVGRLGPAASREALIALLGEGFLGSVDYLFWDDDDPARVTLKVSHESFIRGWSRFRSLVDQDSAQFDEYLGLLRKCAEWIAQSGREEFLLEVGEMRRVTGSGFARRLDQEALRERWAKLLALDRQAQSLTSAAPQLAGYLQASALRLAQREQGQTRAARSARALAIAGVVFGLLPTALFSWLVQGPTMRRAEMLFEAGSRANQTLLSSNQALVGDAAGTLQSLLTAAQRVEEARQATGPWRLGVSKSVLEWAGGWPLLRQQRDFLDQVFMQAEPSVNGTLRRQLSNSLWRAQAEADRPLAPEVELPAPTVLEGVRCLDAGGAGTSNLRGRLWVSRFDETSAAQVQRALFLPETPDASQNLELFSAGWDEAARRCHLGSSVLYAPAPLQSRVVVDADLRLIYQTAIGLGSVAPRVLLRELQWLPSSGPTYTAVLGGALSTLTDPKAVEAVNAVAGAARLAAVPTWLRPGTKVVAVVPGRRWEVVQAQAQALVLDAEQLAQLVPLRRPMPSSACLSLNALFRPVEGFALDTLEYEDLCFRLAGEQAWAGVADLGWTGEIRVAAFRKPREALVPSTADNPPSPLANLVPFDHARWPAGGPSDGPRWWWGRHGLLEGWLLLQVGPTGNPARFVGAPLSTCALWRLGQRIQVSNPAPSPGLITSGKAPCAL